jgi:hypothetical protein
MQTSNAAWKTLSAATIINCFHKVRDVPQDKCESEIESDADMVNIWQNL